MGTERATSRISRLRQSDIPRIPWLILFSGVLILPPFKNLSRKAAGGDKFSNQNSFPPPFLILKPESSATDPASSYGQILRSSSIIGGATGINYVIGMVRTKAVALLLGPSGVGLVSMYVSITGLVSTFAQLGIDQSGVREVAEANGSGDPERVARVVKSLRRVCWLTGILGWILTVALAWPLSQWTFGSSERMWAVAILGVTVLISAVTGGQTALLQGMRRIGDLARIQVLSAVVTTFIAVGLYAWLSEHGIIPVIILTTLVQLGFSWHFSRRIQISRFHQSWAETAATSRRLVGLGSAFMYVTLLAVATGVVIRSIVIREFGLEESGIYQAAWGISGLFAGFILSAMATDFYPRLTEVSHDNERICILVNEQVEIGILLALPGLLATIAFAPLILHLLYSRQFVDGASLLPWFVIGVFTQVVSWPMGIIQRAKGRWKWLLASATFLHFTHLALVLSLIKFLNLNGIAIAFALASTAHLFVQKLMAQKLANLKWTRSSSAILIQSILMIAVAAMLSHIPSSLIRYLSSVAFLAACSLYSMIGILNKLGRDHRLVSFILRLPVAGRMIENHILRTT